MTSNNQTILKYAESLYNVKPLMQDTLGNSANLVFEVIKDDVPYILRVSECTEKKKAHVEFELSWMDYLSKSLDNIAEPVKSINNKLYETIAIDNLSYILCLFQKAEGKIVDCHNKTEFNETLFRDLGWIMGNMHRLTADYCVNIPNPEFSWDNNAFFWPEYNVILDKDVQPFEKKYTNELYALPKSKDSYGIIHQDIHIYNFFVNKGHITLFDFDDCNFSWYACDIANALFHMVQMAVPHKNTKERIEFAEAYLISYLKGYTQANTIDEFWINKFDVFMKYRRTQTYKFIQNNYKDNPVNPHQQYLDFLKYDIVNDLPYVDIDYKKIIGSIPSIRTKKKFGYVIWDWNGTLFNDMQTCIESMNELLIQAALPCISGINEYRELFCFPVKKYYERLNFDFGKNTFEDLAHSYIKNYTLRHVNANLFDGTTDILEKLSSSGVKQCVISASEKNSLLKQMQPFNINHYFIDILGIDDHFGTSKIELAKKWFEDNNINPSEVVFIGDTVHDFEVSKAVGSSCILIANGHQSKDVLKSVPAKIVDNISDVVNYVL